MTFLLPCLFVAHMASGHHYDSSRSWEEESQRGINTYLQTTPTSDRQYENYLELPQFYHNRINPKTVKGITRRAKLLRLEI